jgi:hypothetical protein
VLTDGEVAGVVVSASTADPHLGYAIASSEVQPILDRARSKVAPASTGECAR